MRNQWRQCVKLQSPSKLREHIEKEILPIFDSGFRGAHFSVIFTLERNKAKEVVSEILQLEAIIRCPNISFDLGFNGDVTGNTELPADAISNWLHRNCSAGSKKWDERTLKFRSYYHFSNVPMMLDRLKQITG